MSQSRRLDPNPQIQMPSTWQWVIIGFSIYVAIVAFGCMHFAWERCKYRCKEMEAEMEQDVDDSSPESSIELTTLSPRPAW
ncbi:unnamed protein product [Fusarium graminearum]|uniref:Copper transporter n=1 Tax=Gibberella zeae TaxID=5518 RepID=A0A4U9EYP4_GIBZA|nr:unnamed protein product [Fusarium graminearum]CAF3534051.1 unnamed protein product [Fusarium graminearum]CAF3579222.1 unnamed protein product [Fusarium graminearum]CAG1961275.1 unnamed protein product [Fusarium graminearum]CAG1983446.1 unnamed protein product [Fusarium graminearum]